MTRSDWKEYAGLCARLIVIVAYGAAVAWAGLSIVAALGCTPPPVVKPPEPPLVTTHTATVPVIDEAGAPIADAACTLAHDRAEGEAPVSQSASGPRPAFTYQVPPVHGGWGATLTCTSWDYLAASKRYEPLTKGELAPIVLFARHLWGEESGWLRTSGVRILTEDGQDWRYRGFTAFKLLQQYCDGVDIDPFVEHAAAAGARVLRVLGMYEPWIGTFTLARDDPGRYDACLLGLVRELANHGLRTQFTVFADAQVVMPSVEDQLRHFARVSALLANEWNVIGELANEFPKNGIDPSRFSKPVGRVLWSRGSGLGRGDPAVPPWDIADYHEGRDDEYPRMNECRLYMTHEASPTRGIPCLQSEPIGSAEVAQPGRRAGAVPGDAASVSRAVNDFTQMGANFGLQGPGGLCHTDAGIVGGIMGPVQRAMCEGFFRGLTFAPTSAHTWPYQRGNNCGDCDGVGPPMPLWHWDLPHPEGALRTFCRTQGDASWCLEVRRAGGVPRPRGGWQIAETPGPGLLRLAR